ncbi:MAG: VWA-like domain-containing protein [Fervidobacterium sp.]|nr:VWA-like domain-containing protein [Fervidobacterium sp.]
MKIDDKIDSALGNLIKKNAFYAYLLMGCKFKEANVKNIALTITRNGDLLFLYNPVSLYLKNPSIIEGLLLHEIMHVINRHHLIRPKDKKDMMIWNLAKDAAINQFIPEIDALSVPLNVLIEEGHGTDNDLIFVGPPANMLNKSVEEYYEYILNEFIKKGNFDVEAVAERLPNNHTFESDVPIEMIVEITQKRLEKAFNLFGSELPSGLRQNVSLSISNPIINWETALKKFVGLSQRGDKYSTPLKPNRRYEDQPGWKFVYEPKLVVILDTSGSIIEEELNCFISEIDSIAKNGINFTLIQVDKSVTFVGEYRFGGWRNLEIFGGGETDLQPAVDIAQTKFRCEGMVIFTDGYVDVPKIQRRVLFVLSKKHNPEFYLDAKKIYGNVFVLR